MKQPIIAGAGLAGLIAAHAWPQSVVLETSEQPRADHKALLRFRSAAVGQLTGIEFRRVTVRKGIWSDGDFNAPSIRLANLYSKKILLNDELLDRSIWKIDTVERFVAPENFYEQLIDAVGSRIKWGQPADYKSNDAPIISTAPLPVVLNCVEMPSLEKFSSAPISVARWRIPNADVHQTVYFPDRCLGVYRASITKDLLIAECTTAPESADIEAINHAFGIEIARDCVELESVSQKYGKIIPIDEKIRKYMLFKLTSSRNIYSLGRFATWRNILLDDVVNDITQIKKMLKNQLYDIHKIATGGVL